MDQLNALASHQTAGLLQPVAQRNSFGTSFCRRRLSSTIIDLCGHPDYRLLRLRCLPYLGFESRPFATETWSQLARHGRQMLLTGSSAEDRMDWSLMSTGTDAIRRFQQTHLPLLSCVSVLRGQDAMEHVRDPIEFAHESTHGLFGSNRSSFGKSDSSSVVRGHGRPFMNYPRSLFLASNGGGMRFPEPTEITDAHAASNGDTTASLRYAASRAWEMFASRAYLHQYERYGLSTELLMDCFAMVEQIAHDYGSLSWS
ncbi:Tubulin delta chain [Fasciola gigantica]|uniref:Tubulin delta chain n=1 Tax=Fasciola gigantica TaxID=46835 RepID=A0A504YK50_FASGI|nr:Tubulin delta chain [Fasciola gigantica]